MINYTVPDGESGVTSKPGSQSPTYIVTDDPKKVPPGAQVMTIRHTRGFPHVAIQVTGAIQVVLALLLVATGIAAAVMDRDRTYSRATVFAPYGSIYYLGTYGLISIFYTAFLAFAAGILGICMTKSRSRLECLRNSYALLGAVIATSCCFILGIEIYIFCKLEYHGDSAVKTGILDGKITATDDNGDVMEAEWNSISWGSYFALYIVLWAATGLEGLFALIGAAIAMCCAPKCCNPIHEEGDYIYQYSRAHENGFDYSAGMGLEGPYRSQMVNTQM